ncbi:Hcp family type VI secretion system effector [Bordetella avium]|uniref:Hcp family type VI secretion system effector n=1 Tax=Bordetella avium TaxID=521 RepID=UPI0039FDDC22
MNIYLKIKDIKGNSLVDPYVGCIVLDSYSLGVSQPVSHDVGNSERTLGRPDFRLLSCSKQTDQSSPALMGACAGGKKLGEVELIVARNADDKSLNRICVTMGNCIIASYDMSGGGGMESDSFTISFTSIKFEYTQQGPTGEKKGNASMGWDLETNKAL